MAVEGSKTCTILGKCLITPQIDTEQSLYLTFLDIFWIYFHPIHRLLFYKFPCSKSHFLENVVPSFKTSLSKTLKHYLPLSGNLYYPYPTCDVDSNMPEIRYKPGDSVSVTVAEHSGDGEHFDYLIGNFPRDCDKFYDFFTDLPDPRSEPGFQIIPLFAVQITLFPGIGICLGFTVHHVPGDASSIIGFIKAWGRVAKFGVDDNDETNSDSSLLPIYDRSLVTDPKDLRNIFWNSMKYRPHQPRPVIPPKDKVRATYVLQEFHIRKLKNAIQTKKPYLTHLSSFTVTTAYVWTCFAKSSSSSGHDEPEHFMFAADARARVDPPLPTNYFGNYVGCCFVETTHTVLTREDGFFIAAELISNVISNNVVKKGEILRDAENWIRKFEDLASKRCLSVAGWPKFDLYDVDFGWGKPKKYEAPGIDDGRSISLWSSSEFVGGLEIGVALPKEKMNAFTENFYGGLEMLNAML